MSPRVTVLEQALESSKRISPTTKDVYRACLRQWLEYAGRSPRKWTGAEVERWRDELLGQGLAAGTVATYMAAVRFAAKRAEGLGLGRDFTKAAELPSKRKERPTGGFEHIDKSKALTLSQARKLIAACAGDRAGDIRDRAIVLVMLQSGLRRNEVRTIHFEDISKSLRQVTVIAKGGKEHTVQLGDEAWEALTRWRDVLRQRGIRKGPVFRRLIPDISAPEHRRIGDGMMTKKAIYNVVRERAIAAGIKHTHPHMLRHTFVSLAINAGEPLWRIQKAVGHGSANTTFGYVTDTNEKPVVSSLPRLTEKE